MDTVDTSTRSRIMSRVGQKNTAPEKLLRSALHRRGLRYRLHVRGLPGTPDIVFPRYGAVVFVHGCFWHSHGCRKSTLPKSNRDFWYAKFRSNKERDSRKLLELQKGGWRVAVVWECAIIGRDALELREVVRAVHRWLEDSATGCEIPDDKMETDAITPQADTNRREGDSPLSSA